MGTRFYRVILNTELVCEQCENGPVLGFGLCGLATTPDDDVSTKTMP